MQDATTRAIKMHAALANAPVDVVTCATCARETVVSPAVAVENGLPRRCPDCGARDLSVSRYRVSRGVVEPA